MFSHFLFQQEKQSDFLSSLENISLFITQFTGIIVQHSSATMQHQKAVKQLKLNQKEGYCNGKGQRKWKMNCETKIQDFNAKNYLCDFPSPHQRSSLFSSAIAYAVLARSGSVRQTKYQNMARTALACCCVAPLLTTLQLNLSIQ